MGIGSLARTAADDPIKAWFLVQQRFAPALLLRRLETASRRKGLSRPAFLLSFDCDTDRDIDTGWDVHARLMEMGIMPVYAVPGENLRRGAAVWRRIADTGAEFINHGYREHTIYENGRYVSTVFYNHLSRDEKEADILDGHNTVSDVVGQKPDGFRAPHFGTVQSSAELFQLHECLARLGYRYSTSTVPYVALRHGPATRKFGLMELPVTGCPDYPLTILDSYSFRFAANGPGSQTYLSQMGRWAELLASGRIFFVNIYADPSQVADWPEFFDAVRQLAPFARTSYRHVLDEIAL